MQCMNYYVNVTYYHLIKFHLCCKCGSYLIDYGNIPFYKIFSSLMHHLGHAVDYVFVFISAISLKSLACEGADIALYSRPRWRLDELTI